MAKMNWSRTRIESRDARAPRTYKPIKHYKNRQQKQSAPAAAAGAATGTRACANMCAV
jgi:hypothetical protein